MEKTLNPPPGAWQVHFRRADFSMFFAESPHCGNAVRRVKEHHVSTKSHGNPVAAF
jgi:hypothetical protein